MAELIWDSKKSAPVRLALPFQDVETVNESAQTRTRMLDLWNQGEPGEWRNRLIWGDKKYVLPSLLPEFAGKVDLIYIDPPFATGADFSFTASIPDDPEFDGDQSTSFIKQPSMIEQKPTVIRGAVGVMDTCNGSTRQWYCFMICCLKKALCIYISVQISANM